MVWLVEWIDTQEAPAWTTVFSSSSKACRYAEEMLENMKVECKAPEYNPMLQCYQYWYKRPGRTESACCLVSLVGIDEELEEE